MPAERKSARFHMLVSSSTHVRRHHRSVSSFQRSKIYGRKRRCRSASRSASAAHIEPTTVNPLENQSHYEHLSRATVTSPANLSMIVSQSYKPLHVKSSQLNKNTIAVTKGIVLLEQSLSRLFADATHETRSLDDTSSHLPRSSQYFFDAHTRTNVFLLIFACTGRQRRR